MFWIVLNRFQVSGSWLLGYLPLDIFMAWVSIFLKSKRVFFTEFHESIPFDFEWSADCLFYCIHQFCIGIVDISIYQIFNDFLVWSQYWNSPSVIVKTTESIESSCSVLFTPLGDRVLRHLECIHNLSKSFSFMPHYDATKSTEDLPVPSILFHFDLNVPHICWRKCNVDFFHTPII